MRARGAPRSPEVDFTGVAPDGSTAMVGDTLVADAAQLSITVRGGQGQTLTILRDGEPVGAPVPVTSDPFTHTWTADRVAGSGPLGTFWRADIADAQALTVITNPIFLTGVGDPPPPPPTTAPPGTSGAPGELPRTGGIGATWIAGVLLIAAGSALVARRR